MIATRTLAALGVFGAAFALAAGCVPSAGGDSEAAMSDIRASDAAAGAPAGAVRLADGLYAVPVAVDAEGCEQFAEWSAGGVARQIIYFHDGDGGFTVERSPERACNAEMVAAGEDQRGCALFRAEQPDGSASDVLYYPAGSGYTANPESADCSG